MKFKNPFFTKFFSWTVLGLAVVSFQAERSEAVLGNTAGVVVLGYALLTASIGGEVSIQGDNGIGEFFERAGVGLAGVFGAILLDNNNLNQPLVFQSLPESLKTQLGMTEDEYSAYEEELPEINAVSSTIFAEAAQMLNEGTNQKTVVEKISQEWTLDMSSALSPEAFSAFNKVRASSGT